MTRLRIEIAIKVAGQRELNVVEEAVSETIKSKNICITLYINKIIYFKY